MNKKYSITQIDSKTSTDENWKAYFKLRTDCANRLDKIKGKHTFMVKQGFWVIYGV